MKGFNMQKKFYFLAPVEVVKVTKANLQEVAEWCGGKVAQVESRRKPGTTESYVWVPTPDGSAISWAFPGMFITRRLVITLKNELKLTYAVFRKDYFEKNYFDSPKDAVDATWEKEARQRLKKQKQQSIINKVASGMQTDVLHKELIEMPAEELKEVLVAAAEMAQNQEPEVPLQAQSFEPANPETVPEDRTAELEAEKVSG